MSGLPAKTHRDMDAAYAALLADGTLHPDAVQQEIVEKLTALQKQLAGGGAAETSFFDRLFSGFKKSGENGRQGIYLYGGVGRGKTFLMDLFFKTAQVKDKTRLHFHDFMLKTHDALHDRRRGRKTMHYHKTDILADYAAELAENSRLICFDELYVRDIADAMILGRLFTALFAQGVTVVFTSNFPPDDLYKDGLQRGLFLPFIALLKERLEILHLSSERDYRLNRAFKEGTWFAPLSPVAQEKMHTVFAALTDGKPKEKRVIKIKSREMAVNDCAGRVAWFTFAELCEQPRGAADYLMLAQHFDAVLLADVPQLTDKKRNETRRFMTLIDTLYEKGVRLAVSAETGIDGLYNGTENAFEFQRTQSRLIEMQSESYWQENAD